MKTTFSFHDHCKQGIITEQKLEILKYHNTNYKPVTYHCANHDPPQTQRKARKIEKIQGTESKFVNMTKISAHRRECTDNFVVQEPLIPI